MYNLLFRILKIEQFIVKLLVALVFFSTLQILSTTNAYALNHEQSTFEVTVTQPLDCSGIIVKSLSPNEYEQILLTSYQKDDSQKSSFEITTQSNHNKNSKGYEVWLYGISDQEGLWSLDKTRSSLRGSWEERSEKNSPLGFAFISTGEAQSSIQTEGIGDIDLLMLSHPWSGMINTQYKSNNQIFDLYSPESKKTTVRLTSCKSNSINTRRTYTFDYKVRKKSELAVFNIDGSKLTIEAITTNVKTLIASHSQGKISVEKIDSTILSMIIIFSIALVSALVFLLAYRTWNVNFKSKIIGSLSLAMIVGGMWWLVFFPAIMSTDSLEQWLQGTLHSYGTRHPPLMAMLMSISQLIDSTPATFSLVQSILFWWSIFSCVSIIATTRWRWLLFSLFFSVHPVLWSYSVTLWKDIWLTTFILTSVSSILLFQKTFETKYLFLCFISTSIAIAFRHNAVTFAVFPSLLFYFFRSFSRNKYKDHLYKTLISSCIFLFCLIPAKLIEVFPSTYHETGRLAPQLLVQTLGVYARLDKDNSDRLQFREAFDKKFGTGIFDTAMNDYICEDWKYLIFPHKQEKAILHRDKIVAEKQFAIDSFIHAIKHHPLLWLKHRYCNLKIFFAGYRGHITHPGIDSNSFQFESDTFFPTIKVFALKIIDRFNQSIFVSHWLSIIILIVSIAAAIILRIRSLGIISFSALLYIVPYLLIDNTPEWRFLLPTNILAGVSVLLLIEKKHWTNDSRSHLIHNPQLF